MPNLMGDHIGPGEIAARAEPVLHLLEKGQVQIDLVVLRAIEGADSRPGQAASRLNCAGEQDQLRQFVSMPMLSEDSGPDILRGTEHLPDEAVLAVLGSRRVDCGLRRWLRVLRAKEHARVDAEIEAEQHENDGADPASDTNSARGHPHAAPVFDVPALTLIVKSHVRSSRGGIPT